MIISGPSLLPIHPSLSYRIKCEVLYQDLTNSAQAPFLTYTQASTSCYNNADTFPSWGLHAYFSLCLEQPFPSNGLKTDSITLFKPQGKVHLLREAPPSPPWLNSSLSPFISFLCHASHTALLLSHNCVPVSLSRM